ncbi:MAG: type II secretion system protein [Enterococcus casseliflavus]
MFDAILAEETTDNRLNKLLKDERGLSLVELLAVVVILAIIAGIGVIAIGNVIQNAREDAAVSDIQQAFSAAVLYQSTNSNLNDGTANSVLEFTLQDVMDDGLLNSTSWVGTPNTGNTPGTSHSPVDVKFSITNDGSLRVYIPAGILRAGQKGNAEVGTTTAPVDQEFITGLTRESLFPTESDD